MANRKLRRADSPHPFGVRMSFDVSRDGALTRLPLATFFHASGLNFACLLLLFITSITALAQTRSYPKEIRGYKIERTAIEIKKPDSKNRNSKNDGQTEEQKVSE